MSSRTAVASGSGGQGHSEAWKQVAGEFGLEELAQDLQEIENEEGEGGPQEALPSETTFNAMQMVLSNIMVVSALLLGFIVTGTLLSIGLTGKENYGINQLIRFFFTSAMATMCAFVSLITSFLTSMWGAHRLTVAGPVEAAKALTQGSVLRRIVAEGGLYLSMFFFLGSLNQYIWMVYSGPDICPTYRGEASFCARQGADLYFASAAYCKTCTPEKAKEHCHADTSEWECLCEEVCRQNWTARFSWDVRYPVSRGVKAYKYNFFPYWHFDNATKPAREKIMVASSALMCNHRTLESKKEECFEKGLGDCTDAFVAWKQSEDCMEASIQDAVQCAKVCSWTLGFPPREALKRATDWAFIPLGITLLLLTLGRVIVMILRACVVVSHRQSALASSLSSALGNRASDDEESD